MNLALGQSPPLGAPLRFFITAPLYGVAAGVLLALRGDAVVLSRWSPYSLGVVHLLALGFMLQVMAGALLQLLPVAAGARVPAPSWVGGLTHAGLNAGALLLVAAFIAPAPRLFGVAAPVLLATFVLYLAAIGTALVRSKARGPTLPAFRVAAVALGVTVGLGFTLALALNGAWSIPFTEWVNVHAAWGLLGIGVCLLAAVSYVVVPMFQLTPPYPSALAKSLPWLLLAGLGCWSAGVPLKRDGPAAAGAALLAVAVGAFAVQTLRLHARRRRRTQDATLWAWRLGLFCLLAAVGTAGWAYAGAPEGIGAKLDYVTGALLLAGAFPAFIEGMLYKIVPFLVWLHLSRVSSRAPLMHEVIGPKGPRQQLVVHAASLALLLAGAGSPRLVTFGGIAFAVSQVMLAVNLLQGLRVWRDGARAPSPEREIRAGVVEGSGERYAAGDR